MLLHPGESRLRSAYAVLEGESPEGTRGPGVLYLTSHRLVFETTLPRGGVRAIVRGRETTTVLDASLSQVRNLSVRRPRLGRPRLVVELTEGRPAFDLLAPEDWAAAIASAKRSAPPTAVPGAPAFSPVVEREVVRVRCRYCGSLARESDPRCAACGAPL
ncbi:MAG TPA: hypothetical protein VEL82_01590 [Thermoplasmata archaeon]|nr:hypothetical protein [Thermoplasmata archaeon]